MADASDRPEEFCIPDGDPRRVWVLMEFPNVEAAAGLSELLMRRPEVRACLCFSGPPRFVYYHATAHLARGERPGDGACG